jgi:putative ABC transport system permease protein
MQSGNAPIVWRSLTKDKKRFVLSLMGIMFAAVLMFMQLGFLNGVLDSQAKLLARLDADLVITSRLKRRFGLEEPFARRRLEQARAVQGVIGVSPLYLTFSDWRNPETHEFHRIRVMGVQSDHATLSQMGLEKFSSALHEQDAALIDVRSKPFFGPRQAGITAELDGKRIRIIGTFSLGTDFDTDGSLIVNETNFLKFFPEQRTLDPQTGRVELGLVRLMPGLSPLAVRDAMRKLLPDDVVIWTKAELVDQEVHHWRDLTPIGSIFTLGLAIGFVVGVVICSQILYTSVIDRMALFGMLKAIGYTNGYVMTLVMREALLISLMGLLPAVMLSFILYGLLGSMTGYEMHLTPSRILVVMGFTMGMSTMAALIAVRKAITADPAEVFK